MCVCSVMSDSLQPCADGKWKWATLCSLSGSSVHGIFQARVLEWVPFPSPEDLPTQGLDVFIHTEMLGKR